MWLQLGKAQPHHAIIHTTALLASGAGSAAAKHRQGTSGVLRSATDRLQLSKMPPLRGVHAQPWHQHRSQGVFPPGAGGISPEGDRVNKNI